MVMVVLPCSPLPLSSSSVLRYNTRSGIRFRSSPNTFHTPARSRTPHKTFLLSSSNTDNNSREIELLEKPTAVFSSEDEDEAEDEEDDIGSIVSYAKVFSGAAYEEEDEEIKALKGYKDGDEAEEVEYYEAEVGDVVLGVVVSGNAHTIDVNIGSEMLASMLQKELLPLHEHDMSHMLCQLPIRNQNNAPPPDIFAPGKVGIVEEEEAFSPGPPPGRPVVDAGTVLCAEVLGRTLGGKPLLSSRRVIRRIAWERVRQIKQINEPIDVWISEWNTGGLIARIEGLRAFLPKVELVNKPYDNFAALKVNVGKQKTVLISRMDEETSELILSEREAWNMKYLCEGMLHEGTIRKIYPYGAQVRVDGTSISGLLHISNISHAKVPSVKELFAEGEKVKVMVNHSMFTNKISFSTAELESEKGLILQDKQKVFDAAEKMAAAYRQKLRSIQTAPRRQSSPEDSNHYYHGAECYANWSWLDFERETVQ